MLPGAEYAIAITSFGVIGSLLLVQLLIVDVAGLTGGHKPGTMVEGGPERFLFRAVRAHANTNESVSAYLALLAFALLVGADPGWVNPLAVTYLVGRVGHMVCYYADVRVVRSVFFAVSLVALVGLAWTAWVGWFAR